MNRRPFFPLLVTCVFGAALLLTSCAGITSSAIARTPDESSPPASTPPAIATYQDLSQLINSDPAQIDNSELPITPVDALHVTNTAPDIDLATYSLTVDGLVSRQLRLTYEDVLAYPAVTQTVLLICQKSFADNAEWTGVTLATVLAQVGVEATATQLVVHALDGFQLSIPLSVAKGDGVLLAYGVNGQALPKEHGFPVRLVVKGQYGLYWVKWIDHIEVK